MELKVVFSHHSQKCLKMNIKIPTNLIESLVALRRKGLDFNAELDAIIFAPKVEVAKVETGTPAIVLNADQIAALEKIKVWLSGTEPYFALRGFSGTGKSTLMREVSQLNYNFYFSAPTNKATKVLSDFLGVLAKTTYSLLGLKMVATEDTRVLTSSTLPDLGVDPILVIDEAGMLQKNLVQLLVDAGYRCLFVGDPAQLNPIGETLSRAWALAGKNRVLLNKVERYDNQLLALSIAIRDNLKAKKWVSPIADDNDGTEGVFVKTRKQFEAHIKGLKLEDWDKVKLCCWRNRTVEGYNNMIREALGFVEDYEIGERLLLAAPYNVNGTIVAYTDEELVLKGIDLRTFTFDDYSIDAYVFDVGRDFVLHVPVDTTAFETRKSRLAAAASRLKGRERSIAWDAFWKFNDTFSQVRYGYALTCHRVQGTTLENVLVDQSDILANPNKPEAFRALYVAATRARKTMTTF